MIKCLHCRGYFTEPLNAVTLFKPATLFCKQCTKLWEKVKIKDKIKRCSRCLKYLSTEEQTCLDCKYLESNYTLMDQLYCQFQYDGVMKDLIKRYKFDKDVALCEQFASMMNLPKQHYDLIIPIPSPKERDYQRTFNPIRMVLSQMRIQYKAVLTMDYREKQANLPKSNRINARNPFHVIDDIDLTHAQVLLVDDIYTTGLTVHQAAEKLFIRKIRKFDVFTFAR